MNDFLHTPCYIYYLFNYTAIIHDTIPDDHTRWNFNVAHRIMTQFLFQTLFTQFTRICIGNCPVKSDSHTHLQLDITDSFAYRYTQHATSDDRYPNPWLSFLAVAAYKRIQHNVIDCIKVWIFNTFARDLRKNSNQFSFPQSCMGA